MSKIYFTLTGTRYYHGNEFLKPGMKLKLKKEPDNKFDKEDHRCKDGRTWRNRSRGK